MTLRLKITTSNSKANEFNKRLKKMQGLFLSKSNPAGQVAMTFEKKANEFFLDIDYTHANFLGNRVVIKIFKDNLKKFDSNAKVEKL